MESASKFVPKIRMAVIAVLPLGLDVNVEPQLSGVIPTFDITVRTAAGAQRFGGVWAGKGWPSDVRRAAALAPNADVIFAAKVSEGAQEWLAAEKLGWVDEIGNASVATPTGLVISRQATGKPSVPDAVDRWTTTMLAAAEAILNGAPPTVEAVESATSSSRGAVANALARLERRGLLRRPSHTRGPQSARQIVDVAAFVDEYAVAAAFARSKQKVLKIHCLWSDPLEEFAADIAPALNRHGVPWAVTGTAASTLLAPYLGSVTTVDLYVDKVLFAEPARLADLVGGRVVDKGHRIEVRELPTPVTAGGPLVNGVRVAVPCRVYADLMAAGGRSAEAGQHLREIIGVGPHS